MNKIEQYIENVVRTPCFNVEKTKPHPNEAYPNIEIIIPIFNGYDALVSCLNSVIKYTNTQHRITLLNDASNDSKIQPYLENLVVQHSHITLITREKNLGYLQNVNQHLAFIKSDVILLNADTEVMPNWIEELLLINNNPIIGIVCPVSDNATLLTLSPKALKAKKYLSHLSGHWFPIPTAVGSCMLIKKHIITYLGGFDPYYDPGYGEECDYSMLVRELGYQIACAPASLVKHQGSQSFVEQAEQLKQQHQKLLDLRWPHYKYEINQHLAKSPMRWVEQKLTHLTEPKPRILHVVHGIDNMGGVELFTHELLSKFGDGLEHTLLIPQRTRKAKAEHEIELSCEIIEIDRRYFPADNIIFNLPADLNNPELDPYFCRLLQAGNFGLVHFHSMVGMGSDIWPLLCHKLDIPYFISFHDHKGLCPIFSLSQNIDDQEVYCGKEKSNPKDQDCLTCLQQKTQKTKLTTQSYLQTHNQIWHEALDKASQLFFASEYLLDKYLKSYSFINKNAKVFEPCFYPKQTIPVKALGKGRLQVAFLGQFGVLKGAQLFIDLYHQIKNESIDLQIIGGVDPKFKKQLKNTTIKLKGSYERSELPELLEPIDLIVLTSQIPETYGLTLSEAWIHGIPVVAPEVGAYPSRVKEGVNGFLYQNNELSSLVATIEKFIEKQTSKSAIKQIEFHADHHCSTEDLEKSYQQSAINSTSKPAHTEAATLLMQPPKTNAYKIMSKWLDAPLTFESQQDWCEYKESVLVFILGDDLALVEKTKRSIQSHLSQAIILSVDQYIDNKTDEIETAIFIEAGNEINDNFGNWINAFISSDKAVGTSDYALVNHHQQIYAARFTERFSWHNHCLNNQTVGCLLFKLNHFDYKKLTNPIKTKQMLKDLVAWAHNNNELTHFPFFSHLIFDQNWVSNWKTAKKEQPKNKSKTRLKICLILESNLTTEALKKAVGNINEQTLFKNHDVKLICNNTEKLTQKTPKLQHNKFDLFSIFRDNICLKKNNSFEQTILSFMHSDLDAATIPAAREQSQTYVIGKKLGAAQHIQSIGPIHNQTFDNDNDFVECDLLDDDFLLIKSGAWPIVQKQVSGLNSYYQALEMSALLRQHSKSIGMFKRSAIFKRGVPSQPKSLPAKGLKQQRKELINQKLHLLGNTLYSRAYSNRNNCELESKLCQFKTPKTLPRIAAYTPDDWASDFYRIKSPLTALAANNHASVIFLPAKQNFIPTPYEIHQLKADVLLLHGFYSDKQLSALNQYRKQLPIKIIISIDDLLTEIPKYNVLSSKIPSDVSQRIKLACSLADSLLVSTQQLAFELSALHKNIKVIPNRLSKTIWQQPTGKNNQNKVRVGWAGAGQHLDDLAWLKELVKQTQQNVQWVFFGDKPKDISADLIEFHPPVEFKQYVAKLASLDLDIGVAPLVENRFNSAKSNLKLIEFAALSIPIVASNIKPYQNSPAMLLPNDTKQWKDTILALASDQRRRLDLGQKMNEWLYQHYWLEDHLDEWKTLLKL